MTTQQPVCPNLSVRATKGALAILEKHHDQPRTVLAVTKAIFSSQRALPERTTTLVIEGSLLSVHYVPSQSLALIVTAKQAWQGIRPGEEEALIEMSTEFAVA